MFLSGKAEAQERFNFKKRLSFKLNSGYSYLNIGDVNTWIESQNNYYVTDALRRNASLPEQFETLHSGLSFGGEVLIDLTSKWAVAFGIEHIYMKNKSSLTYISYYNDEYNYFLTNVIKTIPLKVGVYYSFPISHKIKFFLNGGVGYYFAQSSQDYHIQYDYYWAAAKRDMSSSDFGFHGGIGFEYYIKKYLSLVFESRGIYARINKFKGTKKYTNSYGAELTQEGIFYCWEELDKIWGIGVSHILPEKPEPFWYRRDIREFTLDLSGVSLRIGIKIRIF